MIAIDWTPLERWALTEGIATERVLSRVRDRDVDLRNAEREVGAEILAELRGRGLRVRLGEDGQPRVGPRERVTPEVLELLRAERESVLAALKHEQEEGR